MKKTEMKANTKSKILAIVMAAAMVVTMAGCAQKPAENSQASQGSVAGDSGTENVKLKVGILQVMDHVALDSAREGFIKALEDGGYKDGDTIEIDYQNAQGDQSNLMTMSQRFVNNKNDLVLAVGTGAAQTVASQTTQIPVLFTAVTDPVGAGLVNSSEAPGANITGTNDMSPIKEQIELLLRLYPDIKTIGLLYTSSEDNSAVQAEIVKEILAEKKIEWVEQTVTSSNDVQQATQSIVSKCDAIYIPTDNTFATAMPIVGGVVKKSKTPVVCGDIGMTSKGGLATLGLNYYNLGYQTGEMAVRILKGEKPAAMPVESLVKYDYIVSKDMAEALGVEIPADLQEYME